MQLKLEKPRNCSDCLQTTTLLIYAEVSKLIIKATKGMSSVSLWSKELKFIQTEHRAGTDVQRIVMFSIFLIFKYIKFFISIDKSVHVLLIKAQKWG